MYKKLLERAISVQPNAYAPYSNFKVGASILCENGDVFDGVNIENASYSVTCCAERVALFKAISSGNNKFKAIAVVGGKNGEKLLPKCVPCGVCLQALSEFVSGDFIVVTGDKNNFTTFKFSELFTEIFQKNSLL